MEGASGRVGILTGLTAQVRGKAQAYFIKGNSNATGCSANRVQHRETGWVLQTKSNELPYTAVGPTVTVRYWTPNCRLRRRHLARINLLLP